MNQEGNPIVGGIKVEERRLVMELSANTQKEKGDCLPQGVVLQLPPMKRCDFEQNDLKVLRDIWSKMKRQDEFITRYGDIARLSFIPSDAAMLTTMLKFWDPSYRCFTFQHSDFVPTIEEYSRLLNLENLSKDKVYHNKPQNTPKRTLSRLIGIHANQLEKYMRMQGQCLNADFLVSHAEKHIDEDKGMTMLALAIYGLVLFPRIKGHIDGQVIKLFEQVKHGVHPAPAILAETIRSFNHCRNQGEGRFWGCSQLLTIWMLSHLTDLDSFGYPKVKCDLYTGFKDILLQFCSAKWPQLTPTEDQWLHHFTNMKEVIWRAKWFPLTHTIYRCGSKPWIPLIGPWGVVSHAPSMVRRQAGSLQFIPVTHDLSQMDFSYEDDKAHNKVKEVICDWKDIRCMKSGVPTIDTTPEYPIWQSTRGKGFMAPVIPDPSFPTSQSEILADYKTEAERKYEIAFKELQEKEKVLLAENKKIKEREEFATNRLNQAMEMIRKQKASIKSRDLKIDKLKGMMHEEDRMLDLYEARIDDLQNKLEMKVQEVNEYGETIICLKDEIARLQGSLHDYISANDQWSEMYDQMEQRVNALIEDIRKVTTQARKRARQSQELELELPPGKVQKFLSEIFEDFHQLGKFH